MFGFTILRNDSFSTNTPGVTTDLLNMVEATLITALETWGQYIEAPLANITVNLAIEEFGGNTLAAAGPVFISFNGEDFVDLVNQELSTNSDMDLSGVIDFDANLDVDLSSLTDGSFFIDGTTAPNPANLNFNQADLFTVLLHELGHVLGFNTSPTLGSVFGEFVTEINGEFFFTGANAVAAFGGNVPLDVAMFIVDGETVSIGDGHINEASSIGDDLLSPLLTNGVRAHVNPLHIAIFQDLGLTAVTQSEGDDNLFGFELVDDALTGLAGNDTLSGLSGNDTLLGDAAPSLSVESLEGQLFRAFQAVFDRAPDAGGFNAFLTEMRLGNLTQEGIIAEFVMSAEFQQTFGALDNQGFVEQLFRNVLDREGDAGGIAAFTAALDGGRSRASVVEEFANSPEFVQLLAVPSSAFATNVIIDPAEAQVFRIFQAVFLRDPDEGGFTAFTNSIQAGVLTVEEITAEFVESQEFQITYGDLNNSDFVELLFANVLPGNTDQVGRAAFTAALDAGTLTRADMVAEFVDSFEFVQRMASAAAEFVANTFTSSGDILDGGIGNDILFGGRGADTFVFDTQNGDQDTILDFTSGTDTLDISGNASFDSFAEIFAAGTQNRQDTVFDFGDDNILTLESVTLSELTADDFGAFIG